MFNFTSWDSKHRFEGHRFSELMAEEKIQFLLKNTVNGKEFNRHKFNSMNSQEQREFDASFYKKKIEYGFSVTGDGESWFVIPKNVFEMIKNKYPTIKIKQNDFYAKPMQY